MNQLFGLQHRTKERFILQEVPMSYKKGAPFCTSVWILERSQARIGLTMNFILNSIC